MRVRVRLRQHIRVYRRGISRACTDESPCACTDEALTPEVVSLLASMGLAINVSKACVLAVPLPPAQLPGCLARFPVIALST